MDRFDEFMERRGHRFVRYADDLAIFVLTSEAAERVIESSIRFFKGEQMKLKVDHEKSCFGSTVDMKLLGFELHPRKGRVYISVHPKAVARFKKRVIQLTKRNRVQS